MSACRHEDIRCFDGSGPGCRCHKCKEPAVDIIDDLRQQLAERDVATAEAAAIRRVLEVCRHELASHCGYFATDNIDLYNNLISEGYEPHKAWDRFSSTLVEFDCKRTISQIDAALASTPLAAAMLRRLEAADEIVDALLSIGGAGSGNSVTLSAREFLAARLLAEKWRKAKEEA